MYPNSESVIEAGSHSLMSWKEFWRYRELFYFFSWRDIKIKYKQTVLGFAWAILQPLIMMLVFTLFFGRALNIPSQNLPYPVFVFSGLLIWNCFSAGLSNASNSMVNNAQIIKKIYFPRLIIPVSSIFVALFDFLIAFGLFIPLLIFYKQPVAITALWYWPFAILVIVVAMLGLGSWLAALNVKYRDFRYIIPFLLQVLFFLTPVIYPPSMVSHPTLKYILVASPTYAAVELFRAPLTGVAPELALIGISVGSCVVFLIAGLLYFQRTEDYFADFA